VAGSSLPQRKVCAPIWRAAQESIANELAAAQEVVSNLPQALQEARRGRRRPRPIFLIAAGAAVLALGR